MDLVDQIFNHTWTHKTCEVCHKAVEPRFMCVCPPCPKCGQIGVWTCYTHTTDKYHGLTSHAVAVARQEYRVEAIRQQLEWEEQGLEDIKNDPGYVYPYEKHSPSKGGVGNEQTTDS